MAEIQELLRGGFRSVAELAEVFMSTIDRQRISAVRILESLGYSFSESDWRQPSGNGSFAPEADELHALLVERAVMLSGGGEETPEADELCTIADALEAYEAKRWPDCKASGVKR